MLVTSNTALPSLSFDDSVTTTKYKFTKCFNSGITEQEILKAAQVCNEVYKDFDPALFEIPICINSNTDDQSTENIFETEEREKILFKYDNNGNEFYISNRCLVLYKNENSKKVQLALSQIERLSMETKQGVVYFIVNEIEDFRIEVIRQSVNSCSLMLIELSAQKGDKRFASIINLTEQFIRLLMLNSNNNILMSNRITPNQIVNIKAKFGFNLENDGNYICWLMGDYAVYLNDSEISFCGFVGGKNRTRNYFKALLYNAKIDLLYRAEGGSDMALTLGLGLGPLGAILGSAYDSAHQPKYFFGGCIINNNKIQEHVFGMQLNDAILLRFIIAACT